MTVTIDVQTIHNGIAQCLLHVGPKRIPFEIGCYGSLDRPVDREQFIQRLTDAAEKALRRDHHKCLHDRLIGTYTIELDLLDDAPPPPPVIQRHADVLNIEVLGNTGHILLRFAGRELALHPNKQRNVSIAGVTGPVDVIPVSNDGVMGNEVRVA